MANSIYDYEPEPYFPIQRGSALPVQPIMNWGQYQQPAPAPQSQGMPGMPPGLLNMISGGSGGGAEGGGAGSALGSLSPASFLPLAYAAAIGFGKNTEANHPNTPGGDISLALLGPSASQIWQDPIGMGLPALLGVPFITPWTAKPEAKAAKPEWSGLVPGVSNFGA